MCRPAKSIQGHDVCGVCVCDSLSRVFSWSTSLRRCSSSSLRSFELKLRNEREGVSPLIYIFPRNENFFQKKVFLNWTWCVNIVMSIMSSTYHQFRPQLRPTATPLMHLSSRLPSDVALLMCPRRLLSSRPTSLLHCSILLSAPGLCPLLDSSLSRSFSLNASCSPWTSSGK